MRKTYFACILVLGITFPALAGGDIESVPGQPIDNWGGFYIGVQAGYIWNDVDLYEKDFNPDGSFNSSYYAHGITPSGIIGGVFAGYNWRVENNWILGLEAGFNRMSNEDKKAEYWIQGGTLSGFDYYVRQNWEASVVGKVGKVVNEDFLPYVLMGITWTELKGKYGSDIYPLGGNIGDWHSDTTCGLTVGAGLEYMLSSNFHLRVEYRYNRYKDAEIEHRYTGNIQVVESNSFDTHTVTFGFIYRF